VGGALGNVHDRLRYQAVVDFLDFHWGDRHWPAFNVADIFICLGLGLLVLFTFLTMGRKPVETPKQSGQTKRFKRKNS
jgi:signal peptidase II